VKKINRTKLLPDIWQTAGDCRVDGRCIDGLNKVELARRQRWQKGAASTGLQPVAPTILPSALC
jgi:hypothetical protein